MPGMRLLTRLRLESSATWRCVHWNSTPLAPTHSGTSFVAITSAVPQPGKKEGIGGSKQILGERRKRGRVEREETKRKGGKLRRGRGEGTLVTLLYSLSGRIKFGVWIWSKHFCYVISIKKSIYNLIGCTNIPMAMVMTFISPLPKTLVRTTYMPSGSNRSTVHFKASYISSRKEMQQ